MSTLYVNCIVIKKKVVQVIVTASQVDRLYLPLWQTRDQGGERDLGLQLAQEGQLGSAELG